MYHGQSKITFLGTDHNKIDVTNKILSVVTYLKVKTWMNMVYLLWKDSSIFNKIVFPVVDGFVGFGWIRLECCVWRKLKYFL